MANPRGPGISGFAVAMIGTGALAVYSAIKGTSPLEELRGIITGKRPEPLATTPSGTPLEAFSGGTIPNAGTGGRGSGAKLSGTVGVKPHVLAEMHYISDTWGITTGGFATSGHVTNSDHYVGLAIDAMLPAGANRVAMGNAINQYYMTNAAAKHVKYIIWQHTIWSPDRGARPYRKNDHFNHVHISFYPVVQGRIGR